MTLSTTTNKNEYLGNGVTTVFAYDFLVLDESHMTCYIDGNLLNPAVYTVDNIGNPNGGNVTFDTPPADQISVVLYRQVPVTQLVDYQPYDPFPSETHETALDKLTMICQQLEEGLSRTNQDPIGGDPLEEEFPLGTVLFFQTGLGALPGNWTLKDVGDVVLGVSNGTDKLYSGAGPGQNSAGSWTIVINGNSENAGGHNHQWLDSEQASGYNDNQKSWDSGGGVRPIINVGNMVNPNQGIARTLAEVVGEDMWTENEADHLHAINIANTTYRPQAATGVLAEKTSSVIP